MDANATRTSGLHVPIGAPVGQLPEPTDSSTDSAAVFRTHFEMTFQQILDRYGIPDVVLIRDGRIDVHWTYKSGWSFTFVDGVVMEVGRTR